MTETLNLTRSLDDDQLDFEREAFISRNAPQLGTVEIDFAQRAILAAAAEKKANESLAQINEFTD